MKAGMTVSSAWIQDILSLKITLHVLLTGKLPWNNIFEPWPIWQMCTNYLFLPRSLAYPCMHPESFSVVWNMMLGNNGDIAMVDKVAWGVALPDSWILFWWINHTPFDSLSNQIMHITCFLRKWGISISFEETALKRSKSCSKPHSCDSYSEHPESCSPNTNCSLHSFQWCRIQRTSHSLSFLMASINQGAQSRRCNDQSPWFVAS